MFTSKLYKPDFLLLYSILNNIPVRYKNYFYSTAFYFLHLSRVTPIKKAATICLNTSCNKCIFSNSDLTCTIDQLRTHLDELNQ